MLRRELFADILKVGAVSCISPLQSVLATLIVTGLVAHLGVLPLAGYSIGQRPAFGLFGLGLTLYFAAQGSGRVLGPVLAGTLRLLLVAGVGAWLAARQAGAANHFALVAAAMVAYGLATAAAVKLTRWQPVARRAG